MGRTMIDLLQITPVLDTATLREIRDELRLANGHPATVLSQQPQGMLAPRVRKATRVSVSPETRERITRHLLERKTEIEEHFELSLTECEEPQFLRYETGDFFVPHQDGNTPLIYDETRFRKVSVVIFLSEQFEHPMPEGFCGGSLVLHGRVGQSEPPLTVAPAPGMLMAFPAETTHEVLPITHGERLSIVSWYRG